MSKVIFCANTRLTSGSEHTYSKKFFGNAQGQYNFFNSKAIKTFNKGVPIQFDPSTITIGIPAESIYLSDYVIIQNDNSKIYYAFLNKIEYVNLESCRITIEIDFVQSFLFDINYLKSFVIREHSESDIIGENLLAEEFSYSEYILDNHQRTVLFDYYSVVVVTSDKGNIQGGVPRGYVGGMFSGLYYLHFNLNTPDDVTAVLAYLDELTTNNKQDAVVSIFLMPTEFYTTKEVPTVHALQFDFGFSDIGGYVPRNKKCFTYPYNTLYGTTFQGNGATFHYEYFQQTDTGKLKFNCTSGMSPNPEIICYPVNYRGTIDNLDEKMVITGFPQCAFTVDAFRAWIAQKGSVTAIEAVGGVIGAVAGVATTASTANPALGSAIGLGVAGVAGKTLLNVVGNLNQARITPDHARGSQGGNTLVSLRWLDFHFYQAHYPVSIIKKLDSFFDKKGYKIATLTIPNVESRKSWNHEEVQDFCFSGNLPQQAIKSIKHRFENITFWHGDFLGDYSKDNTI